MVSATALVNEPPTAYDCAGDVQPPLSALPNKTAVLRHAVEICGQLSELAARNADLASVAEVLAARSHCPTLVLDRTQKVLASAGADAQQLLARVLAHGESRALKRILTAAAGIGRALPLPGARNDGSRVVVAPVAVDDGEAPVYVFTLVRAGELDEDVQTLLTEHAAMICGVVMSRQQAVAEAAGSARRDLMEGLLLRSGRDGSDAERWARYLGIDSACAQRVLAIDCAGHDVGDSCFRCSVAFRSLERMLALRSASATAVNRDGEIVVIIPEPVCRLGGSKGLRALAEECRTTLENRCSTLTVTVGIGGVCASPADIARSYAEARQALKTADRAEGGGGVVAFQDLGVQRLLLQVPDVDGLRTFAGEVLGGLLSPVPDTELIRTLTEYFVTNGSPRRTAATLHVHPNTVTYRLRRIEEITGLQLTRYRDRLMAQVALEIVNGPLGAPTSGVRWGLN